MTVEEKMILAIQVGEIALKNGELPVGAVIFKGNEIVGKAYSSGESSKIYLRHAEMKVLWEVDEKGYSVRERKKMQLFVTLEPCMMCLGAAMGFFIGEVYYALESPVDGAISLLNDRWRTNNEVLQSYTLPKCYGGILREEGKTLLRKYIIAKKEGAFVDFCNTLLNL
jgi:tRNA(adenine34) deaminase